MKLILGSQSQGRRSVLESMGYDFEVVVADIDEKEFVTLIHKNLLLKLLMQKLMKLLKR